VGVTRASFTARLWGDVKIHAQAAQRRGADMRRDAYAGAAGQPADAAQAR
jgi:hypothetical protein